MPDTVAHLDISRIFFGEGERASALFLVEIVIRTVTMYIYTIVLARMVGGGSIGQIGPFEFVLVIAVGSAAGDPMFYPDVPLLNGLAVITVVILLHRSTQWFLERNPKAERFLEGHPVLVVSSGKVVEHALGAGELTRQELMSMLRTSGIRNIGTVERAYFEPSGRLSIFQYAESAAIAGESTLPSK